MEKSKNLIIRITNKEKQKIEENSKKFGFHTVSEYLRFVGVNTKSVEIKNG